MLDERTAKGLRAAVTRLHPRPDFKRNILRAFTEGIEPKPDTTFGNVKADVLVLQPHYVTSCTLPRPGSSRSAHPATTLCTLGDHDHRLCTLGDHYRDRYFLYVAPPSKQRRGSGHALSKGAHQPTRHTAAIRAAAAP
jgi:hypothetical protein